MDHYQVLGLSDKATLDEIKTTFRQFAVKYHPDKNPNDATAEKKFKEALAAYEVLSDPDKRRAYDSQRQEPHDVFDGKYNVNFGYGGVRGDDITCYIAVNLEAVLTGCDVPIEFDRKVACMACGGVGGSVGICGGCHGVGWKLLPTMNGVQSKRKCQKCDGLGSAIDVECIACQRSGFSGNECVTYMVQVPPGIDNLMVMTFKDQGNPGRFGGANGDLLVVVKIRDHPLFERQGDDLICKVPVAYPKLVLGGEISILNLNRTAIKFNIPQSTAVGTRFRLHNLGLPKRNAFDPAVRGDLFVEIKIDIPTNLSSDHRIAIEQLAEVANTESFRQICKFESKMSEFLDS